MYNITSKFFNDKEGVKLIEKLEMQNKQIINFAYFNTLSLFSSSDNFEISRFSLIRKLLTHLISLSNLENGTKIISKGKENVVFDKDSVLSIGRIIIENYLTFYTIYFNPIEYKEKLFRYYIYCYTEKRELYNRHIILSQDKDISNLNLYVGIFKKPDNEVILNKLREQAEYYRNQIVNNPLYSTLSKIQKKKIENRSPEWKIDGNWYELAYKAKFNKSFFEYMYNILSSSVHSGAQSTGVYNIDNRFDNEFLMLIKSTQIINFIVLSKCILEYYDVINKKEELKKENDIYDSIKTRVKTGIEINIFQKNDNLIKYIDIY